MLFITKAYYDVKWLYKIKEMGCNEAGLTPIRLFNLEINDVCYEAKSVGKYVG